MIESCQSNRRENTGVPPGLPEEQGSPRSPLEEPIADLLLTTRLQRDVHLSGIRQEVSGSPDEVSEAPAVLHVGIHRHVSPGA